MSGLSKFSPSLILFFASNISKIIFIMRGKRCSVFMIWKISLHTKCCSRTQILVTRWTRVSRVKEICAGKVCKLTSPLHATLNFITLVTSCGGQRGQSSREYGSIYCPKWATILSRPANMPCLGFRGASCERNWGESGFVYFQWKRTNFKAFIHGKMRDEYDTEDIFDMGDKSLGGWVWQVCGSTVTGGDTFCSTALPLRHNIVDSRPCHNSQIMAWCIKSK